MEDIILGDQQRLVVEDAGGNWFWENGVYEGRHFDLQATGVTFTDKNGKVGIKIDLKVHPQQIKITIGWLPTGFIFHLWNPLLIVLQSVAVVPENWSQRHAHIRAGCLSETCTSVTGDVVPLGTKLGAREYWILSIKKTHPDFLRCQWASTKAAIETEVP